MSFNSFGLAVEKRFEALSKHELFIVDFPHIWETYLLEAFPAGTNPVYRTRTEHDCSCCRNFVKHLGVVVAIINGKIETVWEKLGKLPSPYDAVATFMHEAVVAKAIKTIFRPTEAAYGSNPNTDPKTFTKWHHFHGMVASRHKVTKPAEVRSEIESAAQVFKRGLEELKANALTAVAELIDSNALYRGEEHKGALSTFTKLHAAYPRGGTEEQKSLFVWGHVEDRSVRFRNTVIGTLVTDLSEGMDEEQAVKAFETKVAPQNYKRPTAAITPRMIEAAVTELRELGLESAIERRYARMPDMSVQNVLFVDNSARGKMKDGLTSLLMEEATTAPKPSLKNVIEMPAGEFFLNVLPKARSLKVLVENAHLGNFVSMTAPKDPNAARLFKWDNSFAWSYDGELADSIKQRVKKAGGNTNATLRVSLGWYNYDDLDLHATWPGGGEISYANKQGILDVDMNAGSGKSREAVENLSWSGRLKDGAYKIWVNQFCLRESVDRGFSIEIEYGGQLRQYRYDKGLAHKQNVDCFTLHVKNGELGAVTIGEVVEGKVSVDKWGIATEGLVPVDAVLLSPNHWDGQAVGNRHWFFILQGCLNPDATRGIYNEFLRGDLEKHRKVFEVLAAKTKCSPSGEQLSGLGFSSTRGDSVTVVVEGPRLNQTMKIVF